MTHRATQAAHRLPGRAIAPAAMAANIDAPRAPASSTSLTSKSPMASLLACTIIASCTQPPASTVRRRGPLLASMNARRSLPAGHEVHHAGSPQSGRARVVVDAHQRQPGCVVDLVSTATARDQQPPPARPTRRGRHEIRSPEVAARAPAKARSPTHRVRTRWSGMTLHKTATSRSDKRMSSSRDKGPGRETQESLSRTPSNRTASPWWPHRTRTPPD